MSKLACFAVAPLVLVLVACGGKSSATADDNGGGNATGGTGAGGTDRGGTSPGGSATTGGAAACAKYDDQSAAFVSVELINKTTVPIFIGQEEVTCEVAPLFEVADARGGALPSISRCRSSCVGLRTQGAGGCTAICLFPTSVALNPGEIRSTTWDGLFSVPVELPGKCAAYEPSAKPLSCDQAQRIQPGTFTFSSHAGTVLNCSETSGDGTCVGCTVDGNGGCTTPGSLISGEILTAIATVTLNDAYGIYASSSDSSSPSPGAGAGPNGGNVANLAVQLVFTR